VGNSIQGDGREDQRPSMVSRQARKKARCLEGSEWRVAGEGGPDGICLVGLGGQNGFILNAEETLLEDFQRGWDNDLSHTTGT
jgi:hypothetical protein